MTGADVQGFKGDELMGDDMIALIDGVVVIIGFILAGVLIAAAVLGIAALAQIMLGG